MAKCKEHPLDVPIVEEPINGNAGINAHEILILLASIFTLISCTTSGYLIFRHATNYTKPMQQKQIIRILAMVPVYSIACTFSIPYYKQHVYIASIYEFYESLVIASFFMLLCQYLNPDAEALRRSFAQIEPKPWIQPIRFFVVHVGRNKTGRTADGLKFFNIIWVAIFQFCLIKFLGALLKCITEAAGVYCKESKSFSHARIWIQIIEILSLITAMLYFLQFYHQTKRELEHHQALLKFLAIKLVVFLFYVQSFIFSILTQEGGPLQAAKKISYPSLSIGIPNTLLCAEMAAIAVLHLWAYPYQVYSVVASIPKATGNGAFHDNDPHYLRYLHPSAENTDTEQNDNANLLSANEASRPSQLSPMVDSGNDSILRALRDALNFGDIYKSVGLGCKWLFVQRRRS